MPDQARNYPGDDESPADVKREFDGADEGGLTAPPLPGKPAPFDPDWCIPPGETLREHLIEADTTPVDFARDFDLSLEWINELLDGELELVEQDAERLQAATRIPTRIWLALEKTYRDGVARGKTVVRLGE